RSFSLPPLRRPPSPTLFPYTTLFRSFGGFRTRADATYKLLQAPGTAFLVVAAPERDALREAAYFVERLAAEDMPLAGLVLNRVRSEEHTSELQSRENLV